MLPGNLALAGWSVVKDDGCEPWRGMVSTFIPQSPVPVSVTQTSSLPYRRLPVGRLWWLVTRGLEIRDTAGWKPALRTAQAQKLKCAHDDGADGSGVAIRADSS
jgi:hypothetical protein